MEQQLVHKADVNLRTLCICWKRQTVHHYDTCIKKRTKICYPNLCSAG